jgi:hypothetical protein
MKRLHFPSVTLPISQIGDRQLEFLPSDEELVERGKAGDGLVLEYFDSRGVRRTYGVSLDDGVLRIWRDTPGFAQRFSAAVEHEAFEGLWQLARAPGEWQDDLKVTYRRRD